MSSPFLQSQVNKTNPDPYQQIVVLSQATINDTLYNMWLLAPDDSPLLAFKEKIRGAGSIDTKLAAPKISLQVTTADPQLYYLLEFESGTLELYVSNDDDDDTKKSFDVSGWVFAFAVKICKMLLSFAMYHAFGDFLTFSVSTQ